MERLEICPMYYLSRAAPVGRAGSGATGGRGRRAARQAVDVGQSSSIRCPTCSSTRTKARSGRRAQRVRHRPDGSVLRVHECLDCGLTFLSVQRAIAAEDVA